MSWKAGKWLVNYHIRGRNGLHRETFGRHASMVDCLFEQGWTGLTGVCGRIKHFVHNLEVYYVEVSPVRVTDQNRQEILGNASAPDHIERSVL
jgi:hypothetical protein